MCSNASAQPPCFQKRYCVPSSIDPSSNPACNPCTAVAATAAASTPRHSLLLWLLPAHSAASLAWPCTPCCLQGLRPCNSLFCIQLISCQEGNRVQQSNRTTSLPSEEILCAQLYRPILQPRLQPLHSSSSHRSSIYATIPCCCSCCLLTVLPIGCGLAHPAACKTEVHVHWAIWGWHWYRVLGKVALFTLCGCDVGGGSQLQTPWVAMQCSQCQRAT